ncbi:hypothetical protein RA307_07025 [Xanthobacteraceae bacterium Astr-EGSB]|uniref:hypothetical protein n=1 Tax=Astrobacterium formosum TaxID=3069710 RepID=UPI0027ADE8DE|nr:hypothetical protein [Xanthobacteraceae bacterium Astr-EGSB]
MRRFVAWQNLERYRRLLADATDEHQRAVLEKLLAEEQKIWSGLVDDDAVDAGPPINEPSARKPGGKRKSEVADPGWDTAPVRK